MTLQLQNFVMNSYDDIKLYFDELLSREVKTKEETLEWLQDNDNLWAHIREDAVWRNIHQSCDTKNEEYKAKYNQLIMEIDPKLQEVSDLLHKKILTLPGIDELQQENEAYEIMIRDIKQAIKMHREENIPLEVQIADLERQYSEIQGAMQIEYNGKQYTFRQAKALFENPDRTVRKEVFEKILEKRLADAGKVDDLFTKQVQLRDQVAKNADYPSFVEYQRDAFGRFDYTQEAIFSFHEGVKKYIVPLVEKIYNEKKKRLGLTSLAPYDLDAIPLDEKNLKPFTTGEEFLEKAIKTVGTVSQEFASRLEKMRDGNYFDLESRDGKRDGGYQTDLPLSKSPFIFMNAVGINYDIETIVHEAGHAMHSFAMQPLPLSFQGINMEIAEVSSMSMELMSMDGYSVFYEQQEDQQLAKKKQLSRVLDVLPWISVVDSFQYRVYKNPNHTAEQRDTKMQGLLAEYMPWIDFSACPDYAKKRWHEQLHIFTHPFYYIEYGIAQLGAIGVWINYMKDKDAALAKYNAGQALGATKKLPKLFDAFGILFDFSPARIKELGEFVYGEWKKMR